MSVAPGQTPATVSREIAAPAVPEASRVDVHPEPDVRFVRLVMLSGGLESAVRAVAERYPNAEVETIDKELLRGPERLSLLGRLRARRSDRFVFFTYVNAWQLGRWLMAVYGRLARSRRVVFLDLEGRAEEFGAARLWLRETPRTALEYALAVPVIFASVLMSVLLAAVVRRRASAQPRTQPDERSLDILFVRPTPTIGVVEAGESAHIRGVLGGLVELGHRPRVVSNDELPAVRRAGYALDVFRPGAFFNALPLAFELWHNMVFTCRVWNLVRRTRPDVVYQRHSRNSWVGVAVSRAAGLPLLLEWNASEVWATRHWSPMGWWARIVSTFERVNRRGADRIIVVSKALADAVARDGVEPERILLNPNGVDPERFKPGVGGADIRARYDLGDAVVIGFAGSFNFYQGTPLLMRAAAAVCAEVDARFLMVGYGETLAATRAVAEEEGILDRVIFTDRVPVDDVAAYIDACDIAVAPMAPNPDGSDFFNSPVKIYEYMAAGKAIVASRLGQIVEVIDDGKTGLLVAPESAGELASAILRLARDPELRECLGREARRVAVERHTWRRNAERVVDAIRTEDRP